MKCSGLIQLEDLLEFQEQLQEEADDLVMLNLSTKPSNEKYNIMWAICENAWQQSQTREWINLAKRKIRHDSLDITVGAD